MAKEILIVDSDKMVQEEFERIFEATDHHLFFTTNEEEALLRGKLFKPDIIIGGKDLCQAVRSERELEGIRFLILLDMFEDISDRERKLLRADGTISRPLNEDEILSMVSHLDQGVKEEGGEIAVSEDDLDWKSFADLGKVGTEKKEEFSLDEPGETEEEIIELVDVVEEPESRMSIDDFALQQKEELIGEIAPIESWEKPAREVEGFEKEFILIPEEKEAQIEETSLQIEKEVLEKKASPEDELFEKIELEEILRKMERLQPSIEKEWPVETKEKTSERIMPEKAAPSPQETGDKYTGLDEFEAALRGEVKTKPAEETFQPFFIEETLQEAPGMSPPKEAPAELELQELGEEEFPDIFLEELTEELEKIKEEELMPEKAVVEAEAETALEEEISELLGEEVQTLQQPLKEVIRVEEPSPLQELIDVEEMAPVETLVPVEEVREAWVAAPEIKEAPKIALEEIPPPILRMDRKIEEVIAKGVQEMMQDFVTKVMPEMATQMIALTMERIETMVKEVVPDLAEKAIQEEIRRLQKGEKD